MANSKNNQKLVNQRVREALYRTAALMPTYYGKMLAQRLPAGGCGSVFEGFDSPEQLAAAILGANWEPAEPPAGSAIPGCGYFKTHGIPGGRMGLVRIADLPDDVQIVARDPKGTGMVSMAVQGVRGIEAHETWIILGPGEEDGVHGEVVWTFHPGDPVGPSRLEAKDVPDGTVLAKAEALALRFDLAKIESPAPAKRTVFILFSTVGRDLITDSRVSVEGVFDSPEEAKAAADPDDLYEYGCQCIMRVTGTRTKFVVGDGGQVLS